MSDSAAVKRSLAALKNELDFLRDSRVLSQDSFDAIVALLPSGNTSNVVLAEALYDYAPQQADDLALKTGDKITVLEKLSRDWWRGQVGSNTGVFPANYVRELGAAPPPVPPLSSASMASSTSLSAPPYQEKQSLPPQQQQYYQQQPPQQYYQQQMQPMQQQQPQQVIVQQEQPQKKSRMHQFGSQLGQAAIFGAGATIGSDIVNSIF